MPTIKTKKEMNERELIKYLVDHENTNIYSSGISRDGAWISIEPEIESKVGFQLKEVSKDGKIFTVEVEEEITEDTEIKGLVELGNDGHGTDFFQCNGSSINEQKDFDSEAFYILNDDKTMTLIWTKEKGLVD